MKLKWWFLLHILAATRGLRHLGAGQCPHSEEYRDFHLLYLSTVTTNVPPCLCHHALASPEDTDPRHYGPQAGQSRASRQQDDDYLSFCTIYVFSAISVLICCCHLALLALSLTLRLRPKYIQGFACRLAYTHKLYVSMFLHIQGQLFNDPLLQPSYDWKTYARIGEATNPGPSQTGSTSMPFSIGLINPTTIYQKEDVLLSLDNDVLCLAETAATRTVQVAVNQALRPTPFKAFWSAPVPDKVARVDPSLGQSFRGDNLGTAIFTRHSARMTRQSSPPPLGTHVA